MYLRINRNTTYTSKKGQADGYSSLSFSLFIIVNNEKHFAFRDNKGCTYSMKNIHGFRLYRKRLLRINLSYRTIGIAYYVQSLL